MSESLLRTFISVTVPKEIISLREMLRTTVNFQKKNLRWIKFLGFAPEETIDDLNSVIASVVS